MRRGRSQKPRAETLRSFVFPCDTLSKVVFAYPGDQMLRCAQLYSCAVYVLDRARPSLRKGVLAKVRKSVAASSKTIFRSETGRCCAEPFGSSPNLRRRR